MQGPRLASIDRLALQTSCVPLIIGPAKYCYAEDVTHHISTILAQNEENIRTAKR